MYQNLSKSAKEMNGTPEEVAELEDLLCSVYYNMAQCFYKTKQFDKSVEKASLSLDYKRQVKVLFRRAQSNGERKFY